MGQSRGSSPWSADGRNDVLIGSNLGGADAVIASYGITDSSGSETNIDAADSRRARNFIISGQIVGLLVLSMFVWHLVFFYLMFEVGRPYEEYLGFISLHTLWPAVLSSILCVVGLNQPIRRSEYGASKTGALVCIGLNALIFVATIVLYMIEFVHLMFKYGF